MLVSLFENIIFDHKRGNLSIFHEKGVKNKASLSAVGNKKAIMIDFPLKNS